MGVAAGEPGAIFPQLGFCSSSAVRVRQGPERSWCAQLAQTPAELAPILADSGARVLLHDAATAPIAGALAKRARRASSASTPGRS